MNDRETAATPQEIYRRMAALCSRSEHCSGEIRARLLRLGVPDDVSESIVGRLIDERYIDDERFCRAFIDEKIRFERHGRRRIEQDLRRKGVPRDVYMPLLDAVPTAEYVAALQPLINNRRRHADYDGSYAATMRLARYAAGRGFTADVIRSCLGDAAETSFNDDSNDC